MHRTFLKDCATRPAPAGRGVWRLHQAPTQPVDPDEEQPPHPGEPPVPDPGLPVVRFDLPAGAACLRRAPVAVREPIGIGSRTGTR